MCTAAGFELGEHVSTIAYFEVTMIIYIVEFQQGHVPWVVFSTAADAVAWLEKQASPQQYVIIPWQVSKLDTNGVVVAA